MSDLHRLWVHAVDSGYEAGFIRARLGRKNSDGSYSMATARPGFVYVTLTQDGAQTVAEAFNPYVARLVNLPVKLRRVGNILVVKEIDDAGGLLEAYLDGAVGGAVGPHTHRIGSGLEYEVQALTLEPGRVYWSSGVTVAIRPVHYIYNGTEKYFAGGTLDLTSYLPATSDKWAWVLVGIDPDSNTATAVTGAEQDGQVDLTAALIANIDYTNNIPLCAVQCQEGDTALSDISRYHDCRYWVGPFIDDHGALAGRTDDDHSVYFLLAGRSGGQTAYGGTGSGDDLTLDSTSHATKGTVWIQPSGGNLGILRSGAPAHSVHIGGSGQTPDLALESNAGRKFVAAALDSGLFTHFGTASNHTFTIVTNNTGRARFAADGKYAFSGPGTIFGAQLNWHYHDGTTGFGVHSVSLTDGTLTTIIANGTGDVTQGLDFLAYIKPSSGNVVRTANFGNPVPDTLPLYNSGSDTVDLVINANGSVTVQRTGGSLTYTISLRLFWQ